MAAMDVAGCKVDTDQGVHIILRSVLRGQRCAHWDLGVISDHRILG